MWMCTMGNANTYITHNNTYTISIQSVIYKNQQWQVIQQPPTEQSTRVVCWQCHTSIIVVHAPLLELPSTAVFDRKWSPWSTKNPPGMHPPALPVLLLELLWMYVEWMWAWMNECWCGTRTVTWQKGGFKHFNHGDWRVQYLSKIAAAGIWTAYMWLLRSCSWAVHYANMLTTAPTYNWCSS